MHQKNKRFAAAWRRHLALLIFVYPLQLAAQQNMMPIERYVASLKKSDGGYGWADQPDGHINPIFAVVGILQDLHKLPANRNELVQYIKDHHPQFGLHQEGGPSGTEERDLVYQQIQCVLWLGGDASSFKEKVMGWRPQFNKVSNFENHGYPVFLQEMMTPICRALLGLPMDTVAAHFSQYILERQRENGSYNNVPVRDGGDGNVLNTWWALRSWQLMQHEQPNSAACINWLKQCQVANGGFTYQPGAPGNDVAYTWAAAKALQVLNATPADKDNCINYLLSLRNSDGGFGRQPGEPSSPMASYYAVDALATLGAMNRLNDPIQNKPAKKAENLSGMKVFTVQFEAQGSGSPLEAVKLAQALHIDLWGAKNDQPGWLETAQQIADSMRVPVTFFRSDEPYGKFVRVEGLGTFSHILDYIAPMQATIQVSDSAFWPEFRSKTIDPLLKQNGALIWQVSNNEPLSRMVLDETVRKGGYAGISSIHFGQNFLFWLPFLFEYRHQLPFVALQDAHGTEAWWWADQLAGYRTLFVAPKGGYDNMMDALRHNRVAAVRHDSVNEYRTRILGGAPGVQEYLKSQMNKWKWWDERDARPVRPWAAITVLHPSDTLEVDHPQTGVNIRVRCWWTTILFTLQQPVTELQSIMIDDKLVQPTHETKKDRRGAHVDDYYMVKSNDLRPGRHRITAEIKNIRTGEVRKMEEEFIAW